jgi:hypothetical protein
VACPSVTPISASRARNHITANLGTLNLKGRDTL